METIRISIFHTNDMHCRADDMVRLSHFARRLRNRAEAEGRRVFFWDAGDAEDRSAKICSITKGVTFQRVMKAMGYTLAAVGNSVTLPYGPEAIIDVADKAPFPILGANLRDREGPLIDGLQTHVVIPLSGELRMGVIGLTAPWGGMYEMFGLRLPDFIEVARPLVEELREQQAALVVILSHLGLQDDRRLAAEVPGIDVIIGGHSHTLLPQGEEDNGVLVAQAGENAEALGRVDITLDAVTGRVLERSARVLPLPAEEPADPLVVKAIVAAERETDRLLRRPVGGLETALDVDYFHECGIGDLAADALRERMRADVAMVATGQFHAGLPEGVVTLGDLDAACFSSANPGVTEVWGRQILAALERGLDPALTEMRPKSLRGTPVGMPQISGMTVEYDDEQPVGKRIVAVRLHGEALQPDRAYRLAHTDMEVSASVGYLALEEGQTTQYEVPTILREAMEDYFRDHPPTPVVETGRWLPASNKDAIS